MRKGEEDQLTEGSNSAGRSGAVLPSQLPSVGREGEGDTHIGDLLLRVSFCSPPATSTEYCASTPEANIPAQHALVHISFGLGMCPARVGGRDHVSNCGIPTD